MAKELNIDNFLVDIMKDKCGVELKFQYEDPRPETESDEKYKYMQIAEDGEHIDAYDCTTRALSKVLDKDYDAMMKEQYKVASKLRTMPNMPSVTAEILENNGWIGDTFDPNDMPPTVISMLISNPSNKYIIGAEGHMVAIVDGVLYDNYRVLDKKETSESDIKGYLDVFLTRMCSEFYIPDSNKKRKGKKNVSK